MNEIQSLYDILYQYFGPQHWWPADSPYEVVVGAVLTQNTAWSNVERAIKNLKKADALKPERILHMSQEELVELIRPSGFYNQKAERLKAVTRAYLSASPQWDRMRLREHFLRVKGVGMETADSIVLYAFEKPIFVVDAYTRRLVKRFFGLELKDYEHYRALFERALPRDVELFKEYHALIVAWGKAFSRRKEEEDEVLSSYAKAYATQRSTIQQV